MHKIGMPSSVTSGMSDNTSKLINEFSKINKESKETISDKGLGEFYNLLISFPSTTQDVKIKIAQSKGQFFIDRYFETPEQKSVREELEKFSKSVLIDTSTQTGESAFKQ